MGYPFSNSVAVSHLQPQVDLVRDARAEQPLEQHIRGHRVVFRWPPPPRALPPVKGEDQGLNGTQLEREFATHIQSQQHPHHATHLQTVRGYQHLKLEL